MTAMIAVMLTMVLGGCDKEEDDFVQRTVSYDLVSKDMDGVEGKVTFMEFRSVTVIVIEVTGSGASSHPAYIHAGSEVTGGAVEITLSPVVNGYSSTTVDKLDNYTAISYEGLSLFDGHLSIRMSSNDLSTMIAVADIGGNALTGDTTSYVLSAAGGSGVSGSMLLRKRANGNSLVAISLNGTSGGGTYPVFIRSGAVGSEVDGPVVKALNDVNGVSGKSYTDLRVLDSGTFIKYDGLLTYNGHVTVQESYLLMDVTISRGNIGSN